MFSFQLL